MPPVMPPAIAQRAKDASSEPASVLAVISRTARPIRHQRGADPLVPLDPPALDQPSEREREHDREDQERLNDHHPTDPEGPCLRCEASHLRDTAQQPQRLLGETGEEPGADGLARKPRRRLLLENQPEREEEGSDDREDYVHRMILRVL